MLYSRSLLIIYFIYSSVYLLIPNSQFIPPPTHLSPLLAISLFSFFFLILFIFWMHWIFVAACGLFSSCGEWGLLFVVGRGLLVAVHGLLIVVASLIAEHGL